MPNITPEQAYLRDQQIEHNFGKLQLILKDCDSEILTPMILALENDATLGFEGWGEKLFFFLKGIQAAQVISAEQFEKCTKIFQQHNNSYFSKYTVFNL
jgi:hypothetical protein